MRVLALAEALGEGEPTTWVETLSAILGARMRTDDADAAMAVECFIKVAAEPTLAYATRQALYQAATERGLPAIARLFLEASPEVPLPATLVKQLGPERPLKPSSRPLTLGERKSLARTHRREDILLLLRDPHPAVVEILLGNPHVTESDVVRIASTRPAVPASLARVAAHPRWSVRHPIKRALVMNPSTPLADAIRIATTLRVAELDELSRDPALPEVLRTHAAEIRDAALRRPQA